MMIDRMPNKIISEMAKTNSKLAKTIDNEVIGKHEFFYWLGYFDGQNSLDKKTTSPNQRIVSRNE